MNLGSLVENEKTGEPEIRDIGADAQINLARGVVVTHAQGEKLPEEMAAYYGPDGWHNEDYTFFYNNIRNNVAKRVAAYLASR